MEAFEEIYREYHSKALSYIRGRIANPQDAEDVCSAVFEKVLRGLNTYDSAKGSVSTWVYQITRNTVLNYYRARRAGEDMDESLAAPELAEEALLRQETLDALADALNRLRPQERDIIILHYYEGRTLKELSERMDIPYRTVKLRKQQALVKLKFLMRNYF